MVIIVVVTTVQKLPLKWNVFLWHFKVILFLYLCKKWPLCKNGLYAIEMFFEG
jgi:hypothetical protein